MTCAPSKNSDQPVIPCILIRVFSWRFIDRQGPEYSLDSQAKLIRLCACAFANRFQSLIGSTHPNPAGTQRCNNVKSMLIQRLDVESTLNGCCFNVVYCLEGTLCDLNIIKKKPKGIQIIRRNTESLISLYQK